MNPRIFGTVTLDPTEDPKDKTELLKLSSLINYVLLIKPDSHTYDLQLHTYDLRNINYYYISLEIFCIHVRA